MPQNNPSFGTELPREFTQIKKVPGLEKLRMPEEIELSDEDLEEILEEPSGTTRKAEYSVVESLEGETRLKFGLASEASHEHPDRNEDAAFYSPNRGIQMVADGMGGVPAGELASNEAARQLTKERLAHMDPKTRKVLESNREEPLEQREVEYAVKNIIQQMNESVSRLGQENPEVQAKAKEYFEKEIGHYDESDENHKTIFEGLLKSIGCTVSMSKIWRDAKGKDHLTVGNIGDSRTYRLRKGKLEKLTRDDSHVQILIDEGIKDKDGRPITDDEDITREMDKKEIIALADKRPELRPLIPSLVRQTGQYVTIDSIRNRITQAVGVAEMLKKQYGTEFEPFVKTYPLEDGDVILTVSDGVTDNLTDTEIQAILRLHENNPLEATKSLQQAATERAIRGKGANARAKPDDVTALIASYSRKS